MTLREVLISTAMISFTFASVEAVTPTLPSPLITEDQAFGSAYYDTLSILSTRNECSEFFGGPSSSIDIFNELVSRVRKGYFSPSVGIKMSGEVTHVFNLKTKRKYRVFDNVVINANGPFYRGRLSHSEPSVARIGRFAPNTKEVRVLMFLHELGHVVQGKGGEWLLPNDGNDNEQSRNNTRKIEAICRDQIENLGKGDAALSAATNKLKRPEEIVTPVNTTP